MISNEDIKRAEDEVEIAYNHIVDECLEMCSVTDESDTYKMNVIKEAVSEHRKASENLIALIKQRARENV